ncbi:MAG TPA: hypothetical protein VLH75_18155 [Longimicrobiales bacterium]|nr:hypothetical protein [Longimicrobiales bacterium]
MSRRLQAPAALALVLTAGLAAPAASQQSIGVGTEYMGYTFEEGLGASAAQLLMFPVAVRFPVSSLTFDLYAAWAQGKVERDDVAYTLSGPVDTRLKLSWQASPWALLSVAASLPTGNSTHDGEEAVVASVLAMDLLGFREATWGTGAQITTSLATAMRAGGWGVGVAGAYALNSEFEPSSEAQLRYQPGNEARVRIGLDRNIGNNTFTAGATFMTFAQDQADGRNLFQAGNRIRFDVSYAFRAGGGVWTLYAADLWREHGDLNLPFVNDAGDITGDTVVVTPSQNLIAGGIIGAVALGSKTFRPQVDFKLQAREEVGGADEGSGWLVSAGGDIPLRLFGSWDFFPKAQVIIGAVKDATGASKQVTGAEFSGTVRWGF